VLTLAKLGNPTTKKQHIQIKEEYEMNKFEENPQSKRHDIMDAGLGFVFSFLFFMIIFFIGVIFDAIGS